MVAGRPKRKVVKRVRKTPLKPLHVRSGQRQIENALAALAHDIRTPLTGVLALSELLAASDLPERERGWANTIKRSAEHLSAVTSIVLDAVKADAAGLVLRNDIFSPRQLANDIAASLVARTGIGGLTASVSIDNNLPETVIGDPVRLRAMLENLIDNAIKFTARGEVSFSITAKPAPRKRVQLAFAVGDSGIGMTPAEIKKLFRPFAQANDEISHRFGGTGLGLVLVKRLAKVMAGDLTVVSKPGKGSTFVLMILVSAAPAT